MSEMKIKGMWKGINTTPSISQDPVIGMIYEGKKNRGKQQSKIIVGLLMQVFPEQGDAVLRDKENFPHCVDYKSLKIIINDE